MSVYFIVGLVALGVWAVLIYNGLVTLRNAYLTAFAQIDVQLQRRHDLIPKLVEVARAYLKHERETLEAVVAARDLAAQGLREAQRLPGAPAAMQALGDAEGRLSAVLGRIMALVESYPELKASAAMLQLMEEISSAENRVAFARQHYNDRVMAYNNGRESFPDNLVAARFGFGPAEYLRFAGLG